jgi:truncated hemoglobin YjbI
MEESSIFNKLVSGLPMDDRKSFLEKLNAQSNISKQPLHEGQTDSDETNSLGGEKKYTSLPWYTRLFFWILGLFKGKPPLRIFQEHQIAQLGRLIEEQFPGLYDHEQDQLLPAFYEEVSKLKESARFFYDALDQSINRDKGAFYAFLASLEMEDIHRRLSDKTDPKTIAKEYPGAAESELRQIGLRAMEEGIAEISDEQRTVMYYNARTLYCLKELSSFLFDRLLMSFAFKPVRQGKVCSAHLVNNYLRALNNILFSMQECPPMTLLESLFIFILQDRVTEPGFDMDAEMKTLLSQAENALWAIRNFNKNTPLTRILRCAEKDMILSPKVISGGEDWFFLYKDQWRHTVEERLVEYIRKRRHQVLLESFFLFFNGTELRPLKDAASEANPDGFPINGALGLSFLLTFLQVIFLPKLSPVFQPILSHKELYKKENLTEFTENYEGFLKLEERINRYEEDISEEGDLGRRYAAAKMEMSSLSVRRRKIQVVVEEASDGAQQIISQARNHMKVMVNILTILNGIHSNPPEEKYKALLNLMEQTEKGDVFAKGIADAIRKLTEALELMNAINLMEMGKNR